MNKRLTCNYESFRYPTSATQKDLSQQDDASQKVFRHLCSLSETELEQLPEYRNPVSLPIPFSLYSKENM